MTPCKHARVQDTPPADQDPDSDERFGVCLDCGSSVEFFAHEDGDEDEIPAWHFVDYGQEGS